MTRTEDLAAQARHATHTRAPFAGDNDLDDINADLMGTGSIRSAFDRHAQPGDELSGVIVAAERHHRRNKTGRKLYWNNGRPDTEVTDNPVRDTVLTIHTDQQIDAPDDGIRKLYLDRQIRRTMQAMIRAAGATGIEIGARIDRLTLARIDDNGERHFTAGTYTPKTQATA